MSSHFNRPPHRTRVRTETLRVVGDLMVAVGFGLLVLFALRMF
jgi:mannose/fructose/N-acetylgalactosamine-specific phosphotransferase system component IIC